MTSKFEFHCPFCGKTHSTEARFEDYLQYTEGALAQDAFPSPLYTATQREQFISGICPDCQKKFFE